MKIRRISRAELSHFHKNVSQRTAMIQRFFIVRAQPLFCLLNSLLTVLVPSSFASAPECFHGLKLHAKFSLRFSWSEICFQQICSHELTYCGFWNLDAFEIFLYISYLCFMNIAFLNANCYNCKIILSFKRKWVLIVERCLICRKDVFFKLKIINSDFSR